MRTAWNLWLGVSLALLGVGLFNASKSDIEFALITIPILAILIAWFALSESVRAAVFRPTWWKFLLLAWVWFVPPRSNGCLEGESLAWGVIDFVIHLF